jgi:hypothetical protein
MRAHLHGELPRERFVDVARRGQELALGEELLLARRALALSKGTTQQGIKHVTLAIQRIMLHSDGALHHGRHHPREMRPTN